MALVILAWEHTWKFTTRQLTHREKAIIGVGNSNALGVKLIHALITALKFLMPHNFFSV